VLLIMSTNCSFGVWYQPETCGLKDYRWSLIVTGAYVLMYYVFLVIQVVSRGKVQKKNEEYPLMLGDVKVNNINEHPDVLRGERTFLNTLEQMPAFLITFWCFTVFVQAYVGALIGLIYVVFRAIYPVLYPPPKVLASTIPGYLIILFFMVNIIISGIHMS